MVRSVVGSIHHGVDPFASTPPATTGTRDSTYTDRVFSIYVCSWCDGSSDRSFKGWTRSLAHHPLQQVHTTALFSFYVRSLCDGSSDRSFMGWTPSLAHHQLQQVHKTGFLVFTFVHGAMGRRINPSWGGGDPFASTPPATTGIHRQHFLVFTFVYGAMGRQIDPPWGGPIGGDPFASTPPATTGTGLPTITISAESL